MCDYPHFRSLLKYLPIIILVNIISLLDCFGQSFSLQQYTSEDGLSGTTIYGLDQDKNGLIWISTDGGISKFNGKDFEIFQHDQIKGEIVFLEFDSRGRLWMIDLANRVYMYDGKNISQYDQYLNGKKTTILFEDKNQDIWLCHYNGISRLRNIDASSKPEIKNFKAPELKGKAYPIILPDSSHVLVTNNGITYLDEDEAISFPFLNKPAKEKRTLPQGIAYSKNEILVFSYDRIYSFNLEKRKFTPAFTSINDKLDLGIKKIFIDEDENVLIATRNGLLYNQRLDDGSYHLIQLLEGYVTSNIIQDNEKNIWIVTHDGIFKMPSNKIYIYQNQRESGSLSAIGSISDNELMIGNTINTIKILDQDFNITFENKLAIRNEKIYDIAINDTKTEIAIAGNFGYLKCPISSLKSNSQITRKIGFKTCTYAPDGTLWLGSYESAGYLDGKKIKRVLPKRTYSILPLENKKTWIGTIDGLYFCEGMNCNLVANELLHQDIRDIQKDKNDILWIATQNNGVVLFKEGKILRHITAQDGLAGDNCQRILLEENFAWISTTRGISKINLKNFTKENITTSDGLPSNDVRDLIKKEKKIYAATNKGLAVFDDDFEIYSKPPILSIKSIFINNVDTLLKDFYKLPYSSNNVHIYFNSSSFKNTEGLEYQYQMKGLNDQWVSSTANEANFPSLPPGDYSFFIQTKTPNSDWSSEKIIQFIIEKPYWQKWWFYGLTFVTFFLVGALFLNAVIKDIKKRNEVQKKLMESQLTALRAQMNPHFLFNSLNSIQEFIITNDKRSANYYLSRFSRLVRNILNTSSENEIRLKKEIETLRLYLDLEALRFEKNFEHVFEIDEDLDIENIYIPSMLIQPYVENSIKHGLMHKKGMRKLFIRFLKKENILVCEVEDNGIGRKRAMEIQKQNPKVYKSKAMSLTKERLDLINSSDTGNLNLEILDLKKENGDAIGTKVIIQVQINYKK